jgi:hypothetical protein
MITTATVVDDRLEQFTDLGFSFEEAKQLAVATKVDGTYWRVPEVQRMLDHHECNHTLVLDLLT